MYRPRFRLILLAGLVGGLISLPAFAASQVRIVRLSSVQGAVQIDKNSGLGFENGFANLPITQNTQLRTLGGGRAEVEFEDGSTLRLPPNTTVAFSTLGLSDSGQCISTVNLVVGRAYVNWLGKSGDAFTLNFAHEKIVLGQAAHFRAASLANAAEITSFKNELLVTGRAGAVKVAKKKMVSFDVSDNDRPGEAKSLVRDPYDEWDQQAVEYHDQYAKNNPTPLGYGVSDLSYYGGYTTLPGYGNLWQPYFAGAGWNPFMDGAWSWYPSTGYLWASAYPWGWMPYYYGSWIFAPGFGWGWQPGGFSTWHAGMHYGGAVAADFHPPTQPSGTVKTVVVGRGGPLVMSDPLPRMTVKNGTAGLGVPRGVYGNLHSFNGQVAKRGSVEMERAPELSWTPLTAGEHWPGDERSSSAGAHASTPSHTTGGSGAVHH